ncbi:hypothetical protein ACFE04_011083 [Oxalis oulophora]
MGLSYHLSNNLIGILNFLTFLISIPILATGIFLSHNVNDQCVEFVQTPIIVIGALLMIVSLAGFLGACCKVTWLLWLYLVVMFLLIVAVLVHTVYTFVITDKGAGEYLNGRGYKEYRLEDYSDALQRKVDNPEYWRKMKSCMMEVNFCQDFAGKYVHDDVLKFYSEKLISTESGCCKPSSDCGFTYISPTNWSSTGTLSPNPDCSKWSNDPKVLCYDCQSCKAGIVDEIRRNWKKDVKINVVFLIALIIVYSIGCSAFRNDRRDNAHSRWKP